MMDDAMTEARAFSNGAGRFDDLHLRDAAVIEDAIWHRLGALEPDCLVLTAGAASVFRSLGWHAVRLCPPELHIAADLDLDARGEIAAVLFQARDSHEQAAALGIVVAAGRDGLRLLVQQVEIMSAGMPADLPIPV